VPQSITIAAFVFGAVLLLIALLGGGFKIFGAEVSGSAGKAGRTVAGLAGLVLVCIGLFGSFGNSENHPSSDRQQESPPISDASKPTSSGSDEPATSKTAAPDHATPATTAPVPSSPVEQNANINGFWRDNRGTTYQVSQRGTAYSFRASGANFITDGTGTVRGRVLESDYQTQYADGSRSSGHCTGTVSADDGQVHSTCFDSVYGRSESIAVR
jgi:hypothetical protein